MSVSDKVDLSPFIILVRNISCSSVLARMSIRRCPHSITTDAPSEICVLYSVHRVRISCTKRKVTWTHTLSHTQHISCINDIPICVTPSDTRIFADDSLLFRFRNNKQDADLIQKNLTAIEKLESDCRMKLHLEKRTLSANLYQLQTKYMEIH